MHHFGIPSVVKNDLNVILLHENADDIQGVCQAPVVELVNLIICGDYNVAGFNSAGKRNGVQKSREDILREIRERERERRKQTREDPVKRQERREKGRQKYLKQKQNKVKKSVEDMTPREKRQVRKKWKVNSKNIV
nr:unnamed protein product [Callosobruchus analis]